MTPGPGDEPAPSVAGRGHLRASHADREHVVDFLKTAFVQGRLTKEELEERASRAFGSRTYAELAGLTADLPGGSVTPPQPRQAARRVPVGKVALVGVGVLGPPAILAAAILTNSDGLARVFSMIFPWYLMGWLAAVLQIIDNVRNRDRGQLPPPAGQPGWALEGDQDDGTGDDLILAESRDDSGDRAPGRGKHARQSAPVRPVRRMPAGLRGAA